MSIDDFKKEFSSREGIHFNNAGRSPISRTVSERVMGLVSDAVIRGSLTDHELVESLGVARKNLAQFVGAEPDCVAYTANTASGLSQAALGFPLTSSDEVVVLDQEYASNFYPWKVACERSGAKFTVISSGESGSVEFASGGALSGKIYNAIKPGVKIVAVSWVQFQTGAILDLQEIGEKAHSVGAYLVVDVIQGLGQLPFSLRDLPVDFIAGGSHKWMCGILGQGFLAGKKEFLNLLSPTLIGCGTFNRFGNFADLSAPMEASARKFEPGGFAFMPLLALDSAVSVLSQAGMEEVSGEIFQLSCILRRGLVEMEPRGLKLISSIDQRCGITSFKLPLEAELKLLHACRDSNVALAKRGEFIRVSLHAFCNEDEIERFLGILRECL
jgi:selenocysteine lyase/cysteine desulfurase